MALGPVQLLVVGYGKDAIFTARALDELHRLSEHDIVRLVDLLVVAKDEDGNVTQVELSDRPELQEYGAVAGALLGLGAAGEEGIGDRRRAPAPRRWPTARCTTPKRSGSSPIRSRRA